MERLKQCLTGGRHHISKYSKHITSVNIVGLSYKEIGIQSVAYSKQSDVSCHFVMWLFLKRWLLESNGYG